MAKAIAQRRAAKAARRKKVLADRRKLALVETTLPLAERVRRLATAPLHSCLIQDGLFERGIGTLILTRRTLGGRMAMAAFLLDVFCLGVKDVTYREGDASEIEALLAMMDRVQRHVPMDPAQARKLICDLVAWSRSIGIAPHPDYAAGELLFGDVAADAGAESFRFGRDGKPFYMPGPSETRVQIRQRLEALRRQLGADGFDYLVGGEWFDDVELTDDDFVEVEADGDGEGSSPIGEAARAPAAPTMGEDGERLPPQT